MTLSPQQTAHAAAKATYQVITATIRKEAAASGLQGVEMDELYDRRQDELGWFAALENVETTQRQLVKDGVDLAIRAAGSGPSQWGTIASLKGRKMSPANFKKLADLMMRANWADLEAFAQAA